MQSVLVTVDRHEWYAPPQIYTRDDCTGLWIVKPAIPPDSLFLSSGVKQVGNLAGQQASLTGEPTCVGQRHQNNNQELADGVISMETSCEDAADYSSDGGTKKRRVEEDLSADGSVVADYSLNDAKETKLEKSGGMQDDVLMDYQGATAAAAAANASIAERVIEPTLVMFEVSHNFLGCLHSYGF